MLDLFKLLVAILATWRISASLYYGKEFEELRYRLTAETDDDGQPLGFWGRQISCFWCVSFWVSCVVCVIVAWWWYVLGPLALSGGAILLSGGGRTIWREAIQ